jgi:hypothetical protein
VVFASKLTSAYNEFFLQTLIKPQINLRSELSPAFVVFLPLAEAETNFFSSYSSKNSTKSLKESEADFSRFSPTTGKENSENSVLRWFESIKSFAPVDINIFWSLDPDEYLGNFEQHRHHSSGNSAMKVVLKVRDAEFEVDDGAIRSMSFAFITVLHTPRVTLVNFLLFFNSFLLFKIIDTLDNTMFTPSSSR